MIKFLIFFSVTTPDDMNYKRQLCLTHHGKISFNKLFHRTREKGEKSLKKYFLKHAEGEETIGDVLIRVSSFYCEIEGMTLPKEKVLILFRISEKELEEGEKADLVFETFDYDTSLSTKEALDNCLRLYQQKNPGKVISIKAYQIVTNQESNGFLEDY